MLAIQGSTVFDKDKKNTILAICDIDVHIMLLLIIVYS
jgi:hypothetical protein